MDIRWQGSVTIDAPLEQVYAYLADLPRHAEWAQSVIALKMVRPGDATGLGAVYRTAERQGWQSDRRPGEPLSRGVPGDTMCEVTELTPPRRIAWRSWVAIPGVVHQGDYAFDLAAAPGGARLTQSIRLYDNWLGDIVNRLVFRTTVAKAHGQWAASLQNIKLILEQQPAAELAAEGARHVR
jgi:uncharacterized protein YndB with AHSA1/START domain